MSTLAGNTVYTRPVAKVMISLPDNLLERLDAHARAHRETRSGLLRRLAERELSTEGTRRRREFEEMLGPPVDLGGDAAKLIREDRESH
jgi:HicB-like antitoxin of HicAB toxin-antitoxin system